jgi:hypothetical protein
VAAALAASLAAAPHGQVPQAVNAGDFVAPGPPQSLPGPLRSAVDGLRAPALAAHVGFLASDALEGRGLGGRGLDAAAEYVAAQLRLAGVGPLQTGDERSPDAYFTPVPVREIRGPSGLIEVEVRREGALDARVFAWGVDAIFPELPPETFTAPVVFAGYGIREQAPARDDYRGLDVKGRIVLVVGGLPPGADWQAPELVRRYGKTEGRARDRARRDVAASLGARALVVVDREAFSADQGEALKVPASYFVAFEGDEPPPLALVRISPRAGDALLAAAGLTTATAGGARPQLLPGATVTVRVAGEERVVIGRNVIGVLRGSDPARSGEAVVVGAHMDHLGRVNDVVHPGADDNASGVAALLEIAKAFAASQTRPARSIVFAFWTGEEEGHFGSDHYVRQPLWPLDRTAVYLNLDMIGHPWTPEELQKLVSDAGLERGDAFLSKATPANFVELGVAEWAADVRPALVRAALGVGVAMHLDRTDGKDGGSDYRAFARRGVPFVRFFGNFFDGYHEPGDRAEKLDPNQVLTMARVALASAWLLASP